MNRSCQPGPCPILEFVEYLEVDKETTEEGETKLGDDGHHSKDDPVLTSPVLHTHLHPRVGAPLNTKKMKDNAHT